MDRLFITHYCFPGTDPWKNIMNLPEREAFRVAAELAASHPGTTSFYRFADFVNYYPNRKKADEYVREAFIRLGGNPRLPHPYSFVLAESEYLKEWFDCSDSITLDLSEIPDDQVSFTPGDSCAMITHGLKPAVWTKKMLLEGISACGGSVDAFLEKSLGKNKYVEVQLWDSPENLLNGYNDQKAGICGRQSMAMALIRKIHEEDYEAAGMIWREVLDVPVSDEDLAQIYRKMSADDRCFTYVAEADDKIVGLVTGVCVPAVPFPNGYIIINGLGVIPGYRHRGIGQKLLIQVEKEAAKRKVSGIGLAAGIDRTDAHAFYERMGYRETSLWFRKDPVSYNENVVRIEKYEHAADEAEQLMRNCPESAADRLRDLMSDIEAYYTGEDWKQDFADDEAGLLPDTLKRGVLSEDRIYNLLEEYRSWEL